MAEVTVQLPNDLHRRLVAVSAERGTPLNELIVTALSEALPAERTGDSPSVQVEQLRRALGGLLVDVDLRSLPSSLLPGADLPDVESLRRAMPELTPSLSAAIVADRDERM